MLELPLKLESRARLGPYEIERPLGSGGMGEVYRARDTRLGRIVAIKVLPSELADDPQLRARFEREAKVISSLAHPHICTLHDIGRQNGVDYLVMEYLEGETLADRVRRGALPLDQVIRYGIEIADALDKAHRKDIIHRDLKPANVMLTRSGVKLLDFGLAKAITKSEIWDKSAAKLSQRPTAERPLTAEGKLVGTLAYMAPEQLEGKQADARTDVFALGNVLYEMATGQRAFQGASDASLIAAILEHEAPPVSKFQPLSPLALDRVVRTCLAKDPEERWQSAHETMTALQWINETLQQPTKVGQTRRDVVRKWLPWGAATLLLLVTLVAAGVKLLRQPSEPAQLFSIALPFSARDVALSPDGRRLAVTGPTDFSNSSGLRIYEVGTQSIESIADTADASYPFWAPDGSSIGFFADGKLKRVNLTGRAVQTLCDAPRGRGATWNQEGTIIFTPSPAASGLHRVSAAGGTPVPITSAAERRAPLNQLWPVFLPDGRHFIYLEADFGGGIRSKKNRIFLRSIDTTQQWPLLNAASNVAFTSSGYLFFVRGRALMAQRIDVRARRVIGDPVLIAQDVRYLPQVYRAIFSVSNAGQIVYQPGAGGTVSRLVWFDRQGKEIGFVGRAGDYANPRLSRDGKKLAVDQTDPESANTDLWTWDLERDASTRLTFEPSEDGLAAWSPDGKTIIFASNRTTAVNVFSKPATGLGEEEQFLSSSDSLFPLDWSSDGRLVLYGIRRKGPPVTWDLAVVPSAGKKEGQPLFQSLSDEIDGRFSPDGQWVAFVSNETGKWQVYVAPTSGRGGKRQISTGGGTQPRWRADAGEIFFLAPDKTLMSVQTNADSGFEFSVPTVVFKTHARDPISSWEYSSYDVAPNGKQFLINESIDDVATRPMTIILNWESLVRR